MPTSMFENIVQLQGSPNDVSKAQKVLADAREGIADALPIAKAVYTVLSILPEGDLKSWLTANPIQFWKKIIELFKGRKYTSGDYILAERYNDQVLCNGNIDRRQATDEMVPVAQTFFTIVFGVRIATEEDLDSLDYGVNAYKSRHTAKGVPDNAIQRAVYLKQNFYSHQLNNIACWDLSYFEQFPLVAPIPGLSPGTLYTGPLPGGAQAVNGIIPIDAQTVLKQLPPETPFDPNQQQPPSTSSTGLSNFFEKLAVFVKANPGISLLMAAAIVYAAYEYNES
jgi:hypothetical protein